MYNIGDRVKCIKPNSRLIKNKYYVIFAISDSFKTFDVKSETGAEEFSCYQFRFQNVQEVRKKKLLNLIEDEEIL